MLEARGDGGVPKRVTRLSDHLPPRKDITLFTSIVPHSHFTQKTPNIFDTHYLITQKSPTHRVEPPTSCHHLFEGVFTLGRIGDRNAQKIVMILNEGLQRFLRPTPDVLEVLARGFPSR